MAASQHRPATIMRSINTGLFLLFVGYVLLIPGVILLFDLRDPGLRGPGIPCCAWRWHRTLSPRYARWARSRVASRRAADLAESDISGTEWPMFGSAFYLWATEALQEAWEKDHTLASRPPKEYAREAIDAAADLIADPNHADWVRRKWGEGYLHRQNVFYRMLLVAGLTSHERLLGTGEHVPLLRDQVESLSRDLDASPHGLLDDYPGECYPGDVAAAIAAIRRADAVLGTDHSAFAGRALRGFVGSNATSLGLPPYRANASTGRPIGPARGCANAYILIFAPELWPEAADRWYAAAEEHFWQCRWTALGFREFAKDVPDRNWYMDVDSGPVIAGHGISACAFGVGAARVNGRFDHAWPLSAEMLVMSGPLLDGTLLGPRILSNAVDAPYLGEAAVLFCLTRTPADGAPVTTGGRLPAFVYIVLGLYLGGGALLTAVPILSLRRWLRRRDRWVVRGEKVQFAFWVLLTLAGVVLGLLARPAVGVLLLLLAQLLPRGKITRVAADMQQDGGMQDYTDHKP